MFSVDAVVALTPLLLPFPVSGWLPEALAVIAVIGVGAGLVAAGRWWGKRTAGEPLPQRPWWGGAILAAVAVLATLLAVVFVIGGWYTGEWSLSEPKTGGKGQPAKIPWAGFTQVATPIVAMVIAVVAAVIAGHGHTARLKELTLQGEQFEAQQAARVEESARQREQLDRGLKELELQGKQFDAQQEARLEAAKQQREQRTLDRESHVIGMYSSGVEQLGHTSVSVRLGAIYALERVGFTSLKDALTVDQVLVAHVRLLLERGEGTQRAATRAQLPMSDPDESPSASYLDSERIDRVDARVAELHAEVAAALRALSHLKGYWLDRAMLGSDEVKAMFDLIHTTWAGEWPHGLQFTNAQLKNAKFKGAKLTHANFSGAELGSANFTQAKLLHANFSGAHLTRSRFTSAGLANANFSDANLTSASFEKASLIRVRFNGATLVGVVFDAADLSNAQFQDADLRGSSEWTRASFVGANLSGADLRGANLAGLEMGASFMFSSPFEDARLNSVKISAEDYAALKLDSLKWIFINGRIGRTAHGMVAEHEDLFTMPEHYASDEEL